MENLTNIQELFQKCVFRVPDYQRGYSWEISNVDDLLEDLETLELGRQHYTGTLVLQKAGKLQGLGKVYNQYDLVDGQQRLTTLTILVKNLVKVLSNDKKSEDDEITIKNLTNTYLWEKGKEGEVYKLALERENDHFFKNRILKGQNMKESNLSHSNLVAADKRVYEYLLSKSKESGFLETLIMKITNSLVFTVYTISEDSEVGVIFETMNDRGKPLSELEKVKNHLLYLTSKVAGEGIPMSETSKFINISWSNTLRNLYLQGNDGLSEDQLLRVSAILMFYEDLENIRENGKVVESINSQLAEQYRLIKNHFKKLLKEDSEKCHNEIKNFSNHLEKLSERYRDIIISDAPNSFSGISDRDLRDRIRTACIRYSRMGAQASVLPLLSAMYYKYLSNPKLLVDLFELTEKASFRIFGLSERRPHTGESIFYSLAYKIYNDEIKPHEVSANIKKLVIDYAYDTSEALQDKEANYYEWRWLKYFLDEYELWRCRDISGGKPSLTWEQLKRKDLADSVEHVLPKTYPTNVQYWTRRFSEDEHFNNCARIGNLTLTDQNQSLFNKGFDKKKELYKNSRWQIERDLIEFNEWTEESINEREEELVKFAEERWKI